MGRSFLSESACELLLGGAAVYRIYTVGNTDGFSRRGRFAGFVPKWDDHSYPSRLASCFWVAQRFTAAILSETQTALAAEVDLPGLCRHGTTILIRVGLRVAFGWRSGLPLRYCRKHRRL